MLFLPRYISCFTFAIGQYFVSWGSDSSPFPLGCFGPWNGNKIFINLWIFLNQEHFELYRWRKDYFYSQFGYAGQFESVNWFTNGGDDAHDFDTVPYQVCRT